VSEAAAPSRVQDVSSPDPRPHPVDERPPAGPLLLYGLQHVLCMYAGAVAVPLILAQALALPREALVALINADLFCCGLATLLQTLGVGPFGIRLPVVQGVTFAAVTPMILIGQRAGLPAIYGAVIVSGLLTVLVAGGFSRLLRFFPPAVTGTTITIIGLSLLPVAARWAGGGSGPGPAGTTALGLAAAVLLVILLLHRLLSGLWRNLAVLLGLVGGTALAAVLGLARFDEVTRAPWLGFSAPLLFGRPTFEITAVISMCLVMAVVMVETTGDFLALGEIVGRPARDADVARGLRADGLATVLGGIFNSFPYTAYAQNVGLVQLTGVRSRFVVAAAGGILILLGLFPRLAAVVASVPAPVLAGAGLVMFGTVAASGIRILGRVDFAVPGQVMVVAVSLGMGLLPVVAPALYDPLPGPVQVLLRSGITVGSLTAVVLQLLLVRRGPT
jgi:xanthine permease